MNTAREKITRPARGEVFVYHFVCEGCYCEGELHVPSEMRDPFNCPEGCGALYVQWKPPDELAALRCVVCPGR